MNWICLDRDSNPEWRGSTPYMEWTSHWPSLWDRGSSVLTSKRSHLPRAWRGYSMAGAMTPCRQSATAHVIQCIARASQYLPMSMLVCKDDDIASSIASSDRALNKSGEFQYQVGTNTSSHVTSHLSSKANCITWKQVHTGTIKDRRNTPEHQKDSC